METVEITYTATTERLYADGDLVVAGQIVALDGGEAIRSPKGGTLVWKLIA